MPIMQTVAEIPSYVVISPMKNEEKYVRATLESMIAQTLLPLEWVIVNDGSTDASAAIVTEYANRYPWIHLLNVEGLGTRLPEHYGGHVVDLFYVGLANARSNDYEFIVKLDCDISFQQDFFARIFYAFHESPTLGITSGISFIVRGGKFEEEKTAEKHTLGATKVYRRSCFSAIGGLVPCMGWDGIDEIKARMTGWTAVPIRSLIFIHHRPEGMASGLLASGVERGKGSYFMGYHPVYIVLRALYRAARRPVLIADAIGMLIGYFGSLAKRSERLPDRELIEFLRRQQMRKLFLLKSEV
jgi:biofilm PGA synthesis N-glycosyltransferase PgaC